MQYVKAAFEKVGYRVVTLPEVATEMIVGGVAPWTCGTNYDFQKYHLRLLLSTEDNFEKAVRTMPAPKVLMICDRGALDGKAYLSAEEYSKLLSELKLTKKQLQDRYDAVFHLVTPAKGLENFYTTENNTARTESPQEAVEKDNRTIAAWESHPCFKVVKNEPKFEDKINNLICNIGRYLKCYPSVEIERKFLIEMPNIEYLEKNCKRIDIVQTYLYSKNGAERRIRKKTYQSKTKYIYTEKSRITDETRIENESDLTAEEYKKLLHEADQTKRTIEKIRYKLKSGGKCFEIDIYPFWNGVATAEIELEDELEPITFPKEISVIGEITSDDNFKNANLAKASYEVLQELVEKELNNNYEKTVL